MEEVKEGEEDEGEVAGQKVKDERDKRLIKKTRMKGHVKRKWMDEIRNSWQRGKRKT